MPKPGADKRSCTIVDADNDTPRLVGWVVGTNPFLPPRPQEQPDAEPRSDDAEESRDGTEPEMGTDRAPANRAPRNIAPDGPAASPPS